MYFATFEGRMSLGLLGPEAVRILVIVVLLVGVPLFFIGVVAVVTGYIRHDADRFLEELEEEYDDPEPRAGANDPASSSGTEPDGKPREAGDNGE